MTDDIHDLAALASAEGHRNIVALIQEFESGVNRFHKIGEALFGASQGGRLVAIGGINIDPYETADNIARVRRLYVHPHARRAGIASALLCAIENQASEHFSKIQLYTASREASSFYRNRGYVLVSNRHKVSHEKSLRQRPFHISAPSQDGLV